MSDQDTSTDGVERRSVLAAVATGLGGVGIARGSLAGAQDARQYVVEQGDRCVPITPLSGDETVEGFYDYRTPNTEPSGDAYSSYGTTHLQRSETTVCFLYDGPEGLSLVVVHDRLDDGTGGGAVTFDLRFEHPDRGAWVVGDDDYDAASNYDTWEETADGWRVDWTWAESRSDGGAYRPLGNEFAVTIRPAFNGDATLHGEYYDGEITDWEVLSGEQSDPERYSLVLDQPLTIRAGGCGGSTTTTTRETTEAETTTEEENGIEEETAEDDSQEKQSSGTIQADVEILPGRANPRSQGRLPVVVYSTADFDATALADGNVALGPGNAAPVHHTRTDENGDGWTDLKLHFRLPDTGIDWDTDSLELTGETANGQAVVGDATVQLVSGGDDDESEEREQTEKESEKETDEKAKDESEKETDEKAKDENEKETDENEKGNDGGEAENDDDGEEENGHDDDDWSGEDDEDADDEDDDEGDDENEDEGEGGNWKDDEDDRGGDNGNGRGKGNGNGNGNGNGHGNGHDNRDEDD
jgi:hypothetical protein